MKKNQLALAISAALCLSLPGLPALAATLDAGAGIEIIYDDTAVDSLVQVNTDLAALDSVSAAYVSFNVMAVVTADLVALIPAEAMSGFSADQIAELSADAVGGLSPEQVEQIDPAAMAGFSAGQMSSLSLDAVTMLSAEQVSNLSQDAVGGLTLEQFGKLTLAALSGLNTENMGGLSAEVIETLGLDLLVKLDIETFKQMPTGDVLWFFINLNPTLVTPSQVLTFLPTGWSIDLHSGKLKIPHGKKLKLKKFKHSAMFLPLNLEMPAFINLNTTLSLGGGTDTASGEKTILEEIQALLEDKGYTDFTVSLEDNGVIKVSGPDIEFNFVADMDEVEQLEDGSEPALTENEDGNFDLVTASGLKITLLTAPKDPVALLNLIPGGKVKIDKKGHLKITIPGLGRIIVGTFDPIVLRAPANALPGVRVSGTPGVDEVTEVVYTDGTMQILRPSVTNSTEVTWSAGFYGTGKLKFKSNGRMSYINAMNVPWELVPSFDIQLSYSAPPLQPYYTWLVPGYTMLYVDKDGSAQTVYWREVSVADASTTTTP